MTNYEAIQQMTPSHMAEFLDQVYLTGLHRGIHEERSGDDSILDEDPFDLPWLMEAAEKATQWGTTKDGDLYMLNALVASIFRNAGIEDTPETQ